MDRLESSSPERAAERLHALRAGRGSVDGVLSERQRSLLVTLRRFCRLSETFRADALPLEKQMAAAADLRKRAEEAAAEAQEALTELQTRAAQMAIQMAAVAKEGATAAKTTRKQRTAQVVQELEAPLERRRKAAAGLKRMREELSGKSTRDARMERRQEVEAVAAELERALRDVVSEGAGEEPSGEDNHGVEASESKGSTLQVALHFISNSMPLTVIRKWDDVCSSSSINCKRVWVAKTRRHSVSRRRRRLLRESMGIAYRRSLKGSPRFSAGAGLTKKMMKKVIDHLFLVCSFLLF